MPVFGEGRGNAPAWSELESFDIVRLRPGERRELPRQGKKEKLIVCQGRGTVVAGERRMPVERGANLDLVQGENGFVVCEVTEPLIAVRMSGRWGEEVGGSGLFSVQANTPLRGNDSPYDYEKTTSFDNHFHDCDEYWIMYEGRGIAYTEGRRYEVGAGDCVATQAGHNHDFPQVLGPPVKAVYFETTMKGAKRRGHLHEPGDGPAVPDIRMPGADT